MTEKTPGTGHNSGDTEGVKDVGGVGGARLKSFVERIENVEEDQSDLAEDKKEIYIEVKSAGYDVKTIRKIVKLRKMDTEKRAEEDQLLALYKSAIGLT